MLARQQSAQDLSAGPRERRCRPRSSSAHRRQAQPGTTQDQLDAQVRNGADARPRRRAPGSRRCAPRARRREQQRSCSTGARKLAQERRGRRRDSCSTRRWPSIPDHDEIRTLLATVEAVAQAGDRGGEADARRSPRRSARVDAHLRQERPDDAGRELDRAPAPSTAIRSNGRGSRSVIATLRAALAERARQAEIGEVAAHIGALLDAEQTEPAQAALDAAQKRYGDEASLVALRARLAGRSSADWTIADGSRKRRPGASACARCSPTRRVWPPRGAFAEAIARAEQALALDAG